MLVDLLCISWTSNSLVTVLSTHAHTLELDLRNISVLPEVQRNEKLLSNSPVTRRERPMLHLIKGNLYADATKCLTTNLLISMPFTIRPVVPEDTPALSRICLLTGDAGQSAESLHRHCELPGLLWALPYVSLPSETAHTWGFVLVDDAVDNDHTTNTIKGYIVGTSDTRAYEAITEAEWWPSLRIQFPLSSNGDERTKADQKYTDLIHRAPDVALEACLAVSPAHMHVNLLPEVQRRGWGRRLIGRVVEHLREQHINAVWLGMDERNTAARQFYERIGFQGIKGAPSNLMALDFETWKGVE